MNRRRFGYPLAWFVLGTLMIALVDGVPIGVGSYLGVPFSIVGSLVGSVASVGAYLVTMRVLARRRVPELGRPIVSEMLAGCVLGALFVVSSVIVVAALGGYTLQWHPIDPARTVCITVTVNASAAVVEELVFRGLALQAIEQLGGAALAVAASALMFGGVHLLAPSATLWSAFAIAVEAGVFLGVAFVWRRSLWFVIGVHFTWNSVEGLLGIPVSGHRDPGLFLTVKHGNNWLTGGEFGLEASVVPVAMGVVLSVLIACIVRRKRDLSRARIDATSAPVSGSRHADPR